MMFHTMPRVRKLSAVFFLVAMGGVAHAEVSNLSISLEARVPTTRLYNGSGDIFDPANFTFVEDNSFLVEGGAELLPFDADVMGGDYFADGTTVFGSGGQAEISLLGSLGADGSLSLTNYQRSRADFNGDFPGSYVSTEVVIEFTLASAADFVFTGSWGANVDFGDAGGGLDHVGHDNVFSFSAFDVDGQPNYSGTLEAGVYRLRAGTSTVGSGDYNFTITPSPASIALLGMSGGLMARRRR